MGVSPSVVHSVRGLRDAAEKGPCPSVEGFDVSAYRLSNLQRLLCFPSSCLTEIPILETFFDIPQSLHSTPNMQWDGSKVTLTPKMIRTSHHDHEELRHATTRADMCYVQPGNLKIEKNYKAL